jgi:hypothetical protein
MFEMAPLLHDVKPLDLGTGLITIHKESSPDAT